jgi:hypothetical protein
MIHERAEAQCYFNPRINPRFFDSCFSSPLFLDQDLPDQAVQTLSPVPAGTYLSVADGAVGFGVNPLLFDQPLADLLSRSLTLPRLPVQLGDILDRSNIRRRIIVAVDTPGHRQLLSLKHLLHRIDPAVARNATHASIDVRRMIEVDKVWKPVNPDPRNRLTRIPTFMDSPQVSAGRMHSGQHGGTSVLPHGAVTIDACRRRGDRGVRRLVHVDVAITTIHFQFTSVKLVTEGHGLVWHIAGIQRLRVSCPQEQNTCISSPGQHKQARQG